MVGIKNAFNGTQLGKNLGVQMRLLIAPALYIIPA